MQKRLTITIDQEIYSGLHRIVGPREISRYIESLLRPHIIQQNFDVEYQAMANDKTREYEAFEWSEGTLGDLADDAR